MSTEEKQPWVTCYLTDMLLSYVREALEAEEQLDYPALFRGAEGFDILSDLKSYLSDVDISRATLQTKMKTFGLRQTKA
jgi:hypothetical protein